MHVRRRGALSRPRARPRTEARARSAGRKARVKPRAGSLCGGGRTGGVWNVPLSETTGGFHAPLAFLPLLFADRSVSSPHVPRRDPSPAPSLQRGPAPGTPVWTQLFPPPPERGAAPHGGAGNSRGQSREAEAESAAPPSSFPGRAGPWAQRGLGCFSWGRGPASARSCGAGGRGAGRRCCSRAARRARRPCAPAPGPRGLRLLPSHTRRALRDPGLPGAPPPSLHTRPPTWLLQPPAGLALLPAGRVLVLRLSLRAPARAHTRTHTRLPGRLSSRPPISSS